MDQVPGTIVRAIDAVAAVVFAPSCAACGELLEHPTGGPVCAACWRAVLPLTPPLCRRCGDPLPSWRTISVPLAMCARCRRRPPAVDQAAAVGAYDGALRAIVHALKYEGRRGLARRLAGLMRQRCEPIFETAAWVVPVPLHHSRLRERGFNQAADLAKHLNLPVRHALRRLRATPSQISLPAARRHANVRHAFAATRHAHALAGSIVVLVDDVSTTGATLDACARALKEAGVAEVRAVTAARAVLPTRERVR